MNLDQNSSSRKKEIFFHQTLNGSQIAIKRSKLMAIIVNEDTLVAQLSIY
jgi:hypothetical protein